MKNHFKKLIEIGYVKLKKFNHFSQISGNFLNGCGQKYKNN